MYKIDYSIPNDSLDKTDGDQHSRIDENVPYRLWALLACKFGDHRKTPFPGQSFDSTAANQRSPNKYCSTGDVYWRGGLPPNEHKKKTTQSKNKPYCKSHIKVSLIKTH